MAEVEAVLEKIRAEKLQMVDLRFTDLIGRWRHTTIDAASVDREILEHGLLIDGSGVPGWREVSEADLLVRPDLSSMFLDPFAAQPTLVILCDAADPASGTGYERDPRSVAARAEAWLARQRTGERVTVGVDLAFFLFDDVRIEIGPTAAAYRLGGSEGRTAGAQAFHPGNPGHRPHPGAVQLALPPADHMADIRAEIAAILGTLGIGRIQHDHGAAPLQNRMSFAAGGLVQTADRLQIFKYVCHQVAASYGKSATFMARPLADEPGSGLAIHQALWRGDRPVFAGQGYADLSPACLSFIAGIIQHARALNAFTNPTTNSYKRLRHGAEEPTLLAYAAHNRSAAIRIPYAARPERKRIEVRFPDPSANPYLAFTAILMAGLDGIDRKLEPGDAMDRNLYDLRPEEVQDLPTVARSLDEALAALEADHEFLLAGEVMSVDLVQAYINLKRREIDLVDTAPHPVEFQLYYGL
ncbi:MAG: type I glutamate--ammonia ligase [Geminicoccaceae bacterium]|nr:type I glutamate--ammonia ligase [Geminicoccaceae bacterium]MCX8101018.1 type I glutamate--ammonia ligase [Geminicoccaceae bacterium]MDW8370372.1 type I glutamate--ammonia ligase [Geminicoccaceae bacterium]